MTWEWQEGQSVQKNKVDCSKHNFLFCRQTYITLIELTLPEV